MEINYVIKMKLNNLETKTDFYLTKIRDKLSRIKLRDQNKT